jgi:hypothetical protein
MRWEGDRRQSGPEGTGAQEVSQIQNGHLKVSRRVWKDSHRRVRKREKGGQTFLVLVQRALRYLGSCPNKGWISLPETYVLWPWQRLSPSFSFMLLFHILLQWKSYCSKKGHFGFPHYLCTISVGLFWVLFSRYYAWTFNSVRPYNLLHFCPTLWNPAGGCSMFFQNIGIHW